jgi:hypothetical protein
MKFDQTSFFKRILPVIIGGLLGYSYYYFIGCNSGGCAITSSPYISTAYGALFGFILAMPKRKENKSNVIQDKKNEDN